MTDTIIYRYDEKQGRYGGVPARDLTQSDYDRLPLKLQAAVDQDGSPYSKADGDDGPNLSQMTRDELNAYAAEQGVEGAEDLPNKDAVIEAINTAKDGK